MGLLCPNGPIKIRKRAFRYKNARGSTQILHSYVVVYINDKPNLILTYIRPRENIQQVIVDQIQVEEVEKN